PKVKASILAASPAGAAGMAVAWGLSSALTDIDTKGVVGKLGTGENAKTFADWLLDLTK
ncbi:unnamed protein product, partial [marine sediment metagenome]